MKVKWTITLITDEPDMTMAEQISEIRGKLWWGRPKAEVIKERGEIINKETWKIIEEEYKDGKAK